MSNEQVRWLLKVIQPERTLASLPGGASLSPGNSCRAPRPSGGDLRDRTRPHAGGGLGSGRRAACRPGRGIDGRSPSPAEGSQGRGVRRQPDVRSPVLGGDPEGDAGDAPRRRRDFADHQRRRRRDDHARARPGRRSRRSAARLGPLPLRYERRADARPAPDEDARPSRGDGAQHCRAASARVPARPRRAASGSLRPRSTRSRWRRIGAWPGSGFASATRTWRASPRSSATATGRLSTSSPTLGTPPPADLLMGDGLHFTLAGQKRMALEVIRGWSNLK